MMWEIFLVSGLGKAWVNHDHHAPIHWSSGNASCRLYDARHARLAIRDLITPIVFGERISDEAPWRNARPYDNGSS
jgi:hypothetical protein